MSELNRNSAMLVLIGFMTLSFFILIISRALKTVSAKGVLFVVAPLSAVFMAGLYFCFTLPDRFGAMEQVFPVYIAVGVVVLIFAMSGTFRNRTNVASTVIFVVYMLCLLYVTIFMRDGGMDGEAIILNPVDPLIRFVENGDAKRAVHFGMNIVLFLPFGFIGYLASQEKEWRVLLMFGTGLLMSVVVESVQLFFMLGQCDASDILANALGSLIGACVAVPLSGIWTELTGGTVEEDD